MRSSSNTPAAHTQQIKGNTHIRKLITAAATREDYWPDSNWKISLNKNNFKRVHSLTLRQSPTSLVPEFIVCISSSEKGRRLHLAAAKSANTVSAPGVKAFVPDFVTYAVAGVIAGNASWCPLEAGAANIPTCLSVKDLLPINYIIGLWKQRRVLEFIYIISFYY